MKCNANTQAGNKCSKNVKSGNTVIVDGLIRYTCSIHFNKEGVTYHTGTAITNVQEDNMNVNCHTCNGKGTVQSGLFLYKCNCCQGKGYQTPADVKRDTYFHEMQAAKNARDNQAELDFTNPDPDVNLGFNNGQWHFVTNLDGAMLCFMDAEGWDSVKFEDVKGMKESETLTLENMCPNCLAKANLIDVQAKFKADFLANTGEKLMTPAQIKLAEIQERKKAHMAGNKRTSVQAQAPKANTTGKITFSSGMSAKDKLAKIQEMKAKLNK